MWALKWLLNFENDHQDSKYYPTSENSERNSKSSQKMNFLIFWSFPKTTESFQKTKSRILETFPKICKNFQKLQETFKNTLKFPKNPKTFPEIFSNASTFYRNFPKLKRILKNSLRKFLELSTISRKFPNLF